ncbi:MAG: AP endonuclease [Gemmatales bacterium]|nr:MAG: AP endonuclease [Gemmatales bacterium]
MARTVLLYSGPWSDLPLEEFAARAAEWGYQGLELDCKGDHFEIQRALSETEYCQKKNDLLTRHDLTAPVLCAGTVGQAVGDIIGPRHQQLVPDYVWDDGEPEGVAQRAVEELIAAVRAAQALGAATLSTPTGSPLWFCVALQTDHATLRSGFETFMEKWNPILDACQECGVKLAAFIQAGQIAFDLYSAEMLLDVAGREEFGFAFDPSVFHWQGIDPVEFLRRFPDRIYHVYINDAALNLNGRSGLLGSYLPHGDPRRGWDYRSPGHGGVDWEAFIRGLNEIGYDGPVSVRWNDPGMDRDFGAEDACRFVKRLDFPPASREFH